MIIDLRTTSAAGRQRPSSGAARQRVVVMALNSWTYGGVEEHAALLSEALPRWGYQSRVVCADSPELAPLLHRLEKAGVEHYVERVTEAGRLERLRRTSALSERMRAWGAELLHLQLTGHRGGKGHMLAGLRAGVPMVATHHIAPVQRDKAVERLARRPFLSRVRRFIAVSNANRVLQVERLCLPPDRTVTIPNGIVPPCPAPERGAARAELAGMLGVSAEARIVGSVGRLVEQKGLHWLLEAAPAILRACPDTHFAFIGEGHLLAELQAQADALGIRDRTHWLGFRPGAQALMAGMDVLALPSRFEGLPLAVLEAMSVETPVVAHDVDGVGEAVRDGREGLLVPLGDTRALADRICRLLCAPPLARRMGQEGRLRVLEEFSVDAMARKTAALYDEVLAETARAPVAAPEGPSA